MISDSGKLNRNSAPPSFHSSNRFRLALFLGALLRLFLIVFTEGTHDVDIWQSHAGWTRQYGLIGYYEWQEVFNHPPFMGIAMSAGWARALELGVPFHVFLRAPFALLDLGTALLLTTLFSGARARNIVFACYWLNPLAILFSAYHGNTDTGVAFFALLATVAAVRGSAVAAGVAIGVGLWIKLPVVLAIPALFFFFNGWRPRFAFLAAALLTGFSTYLPALFEAPLLVYERVFAYPGLRIETPGGVPIWTIWSIFGVVDAAPAGLRAVLERVIDAHATYNTFICLTPIALFAWLRRRETTGSELGATVLGSFLLFYALNNNFLSFQYLAWSIPFWFFAPTRFVALATLVIGGYVYGAYAFFCDDLLLRGKWDFFAHASWPMWLLLLRDAALVLCFGTASVFLGRALRAEVRALRSAVVARRSVAGSPPAR